MRRMRRMVVLVCRGLVLVCRELVLLVCREVDRRRGRWCDVPSDLPHLLRDPLLSHLMQLSFLLRSRSSGLLLRRNRRGRSLDPALHFERSSHFSLLAIFVPSLFVLFFICANLVVLCFFVGYADIILAVASSMAVAVQLPLLSVALALLVQHPRWLLLVVVVVMMIAVAVSVAVAVGPARDGAGASGWPPSLRERSAATGRRGRRLRCAFAAIVIHSRRLSSTMSPLHRQVRRLWVSSSGPSTQSRLGRARK
mmetsp:Transcript_12007/g.29553  ORF Transcript_12007/g.29553 Transcript_12007/m.29553 type:complete len:253 (+) Transcript_12007:1971-2729(+)